MINNLQRESNNLQRTRISTQETWMACDAEDYGFQMLNADEIVTSVQEESYPVDNETDGDEDNNNERSKGPSNADAFSELETVME
ncbi:uncharacterized protein TNCV_951721 [Trichonephila clavipes]|nr:uncharacterized protein TNCV_951721 [Trichonephila clavipes]